MRRNINHARQKLKIYRKDNLFQRILAVLTCLCPESQRMKRSSIASRLFMIFIKIYFKLS
jgi:hypothetical protein